MYPVEQIKTAMAKAKLSYWQMDVLLTSLEKLPQPEPQQLLQQTPCKTLLPPAADIIEYSRYDFDDDKSEDYQVGYIDGYCNGVRNAIDECNRRL